MVGLKYSVARRKLETIIKSGIKLRGKGFV